MSEPPATEHAASVSTGRTMLTILAVAQMAVEALVLAARVDDPTLTTGARPILVLVLLRALHAGRAWAQRMAVVGSLAAAVACALLAASERLTDPHGLALLAFTIHHAAFAAGLASPPVRAFLRAQRAAAPLPLPERTP